jgi:predicted N-acetyltransferase YhbS
MPDMLARLYALPDAAPYHERAGGAGFTVRRADPWDRERLRRFVKETFGPLWAVEADRAFIHEPITAYVATRGGEIVGFAAYECTRRGYFGPTGVREDLRGNGLGAALLFRCLESMREVGYAYVVIGGVGPVAFYEKTCGAFVIPGSEVGIYGSLQELMSQPAGGVGKEPA